MQKKKSLVFAFAMAIALVATLVPSTAYAATRSAKVKYQNFTNSTSVMKKKAATVKKGTNKLTIKKGRGFVKFTAPQKRPTPSRCLALPQRTRPAFGTL